jgi:hypothetical protein
MGADLTTKPKTKEVIGREYRQKKRTTVPLFTVHSLEVEEEEKCHIDDY